MISAKTIKKTALAPTVLITHAGGFLAAHLAQTLLLKNCRVVVLTNSLQKKEAQFAGLLKSPKFALFECDINAGIPQSIESVDYIFHLANYDSFIHIDSIPDLESLLSAGVGTKNLLDLARKSQAKFAFVSPVSAQARSLRSTEVTSREAQKYSQTMVYEYGERYNLDARTVYLGHVYGADMDPEKSSELGNLVGDVLEVRPLRVYGDGSKKEYYLFFSDAISGLVKSLFSDSPNGTFTLVEERPHTTLEVAYLLRSLADGKIDIEFTDTLLSYNDPHLEEISYPPSWIPRVELKEGLAKTLKSFGYRPNIKPFKAGILIDEKKTEPITGDLQESVTQPPPGIPVWDEPEINRFKLVIYRCERILRIILRKMGGGSPFVRALKYSTATLFLVLAIFGVLLGIPLLQSLRYARSALKNLESYQVSISRLDTAESGKLAEDAYKNFDKLEKSLSRASFIFNLIGKRDMYRSVEGFAASSKNFSSALYSFSLGAQPFSELWQGLKPDAKPQYSVEKFKQSSLYFTEAKQKLSFAKGALDNVRKNDLPPQIRDDFEKYKEVVLKVYDSSDFLTQLALDVPGVIGLEGPRRYLFLFQNNNEIRPTGGFLGSYAVVEVENGVVSKVDIDDIYNPDGQLKINELNKEIKAPAPIANALEEEVLYIRNANWDPGFPQSVQTITGLFKLVDGKNFDGVFAVDLYLVRDLISVTGPLFLTAYDEEIRVDNMYERAQFHSDFDFKEGVSSKKAFMTVLGGKMLEKLFSLPQDKVPSLINVLYTSLEQKHLVLNLSGSYLSKYLAEKGWDGSLANTTGDYLYVVNANLGGTKSNYFVRNEMNYAVSSKTSDGLLRAELELTYENTQTDSSWPGGPYKDYVRVLVQDGSKLTGAYLMGPGEGQPTTAETETAETKVESNEGTKDDPETIKEDANGLNIMDKVVINKVGKYTSFEYPITVNPKEKVKILFNYDLPESISAKKDLNEYNLFWQKQPGTQNDAVRFIFAAPFGTALKRSTPPGMVTDNIYEYKGVLNTDLKAELTYK